MSQISNIAKELNSLAKGYISIKTISGRKYYYLQYFENEKLISKYIKKDELEKIKNQLKKRKKLENDLKKLLNSGKNLPELSANVRKLSGYLMMENKIAATFKNGELTYINEKICPLFILRTHSISGFLTLRAIDSTRTNARLLKKALQIYENDDAIVSLYAYGATITDNYWFKPFKSKLKYNDISFNGDFYSDVALNGELILYPKTPKLTPQLTTPGSYEKCWRKIDGKWWLYKKGTQKEIFSELFCSKLANKIGISSAIYEYDNDNIKTLNFADKYNFEPMVSIAGEDDSYENVFKQLNKLNEEFAKEYLLLIWFDSIINNVDRHNENCGLLRNKTNGNIVRLAPNFDNNVALISRNNTLFLDASKDGFIKIFTNFLAREPQAKEYYKKLKLPIINKKIINECFKEIVIKEDEELISKYVLNRYQYLINLQKKMK